MNHFFYKANIRFSEIPERLFPLRWLLWILFLMLLVGLSMGIPRFQFSWGSESPFGNDDPVRQTFDQLKDQFGGTKAMVIVFQPKDGKLFSKQTLTALNNIHTSLDHASYFVNESKKTALQHLIDVESIINTNHTNAVNNISSFDEFIGNNLPKTLQDQERLRKLAFAHPYYPKRFFSLNGQFGALIINTDFDSIPEDDADADAEIEAFLHAGFEENEFELKKIDSHSFKFKKHTLQEFVDFENAVWKVVKQPEILNALEFYESPWGAVYRKEILEPQFLYAFIGGLLLSALFAFLLFGNIRSIIWPMIVVLSTITSILGLAGWTGWPIDLEFYIVISFVSVAALADSIHIISGYILSRDEGESHIHAMRSVFHKSGFACLLTSVTTSIGMFSLYFVDLVVIQSLGLLAGIGVLMAFVITIFMMPLMLNLLPPHPINATKKTSDPLINKTHQKKPTSDQLDIHWAQKLLRYMEKFSINYSITIICGFLIITVILIIGATKIEVDGDFTKDFKPSSSIRTVLDVLNEHFMGTSSLELMIDTQQAGALTDPQILQAMDQLIDFMKKTYPEWITHDFSLVNLVKDIHQKLNQNDPEKYVIPSDSAMLAQILILLESNNYQNYEKVVSVDYQKARLQVFIKNPGTKQVVSMLEEIQLEAANIFAPLKKTYPDFNATVTGELALWARLVDYISWSQIRSFGLAFLIISCLLMLVFGSLRTGLIAIVPNTFPILTAFGLMGWSGISLDLTTLLIAPIVMGIAVDDTIHFLTCYRMKILEGESINNAIISTFREVGQALMFTTLILISACIAFVPLSHVGISRFAILTMVALASAFLADVFWLPALCYRLKVRD